MNNKTIHYLVRSQQGGILNSQERLNDFVKRNSENKYFYVKTAVSLMPE